MREAPNRHLKGTKKYMEMISRSEKAEKNSPVKFIKPPKRTQPRREIYFICGSCSKIGLVNKNTVSTTCSGCRGYNRIEEVASFSSESELEEYLSSLEENDLDE